MTRRPGRRKGWQGQSLAEFAIVFPIFMIVVGGIVQLGILFWGQNSLNQVVRDAGRYAVTQPDCTAASVSDPLDPDSVQSKITVLGRQMGAATITGSTVTMPTNGELIGTPPTADPVSDACPPTANTDHVWLRITLQAHVPVFFPGIPGDGNISSSALFRMEPMTAP
jgi:Flp pilus assembly protein TadG